MAERTRVGIGYDIHRLVSDRPLILGGVEIDYERGLLGHSDGDSVLHAVIDALLGAAGLGDIGELYPDTDPAFKGVASGDLLTDVMGRVESAGWTPGNLDLIIHAERPNLSGHKQAIAESVAKLVKLPLEQVNVKAKTNEGLGPVGNRAGIACTAIVSLYPAPAT
jgi:2-C-methyl-D-erythritol 2,4-cyclodiphosphate synthase